MPHPHHADACDKTRLRLLHQREQAATLARHATRIATLAIHRLHRHDPQAAVRLHRALTNPNPPPPPPTPRVRRPTVNAARAHQAILATLTGGEWTTRRHILDATGLSPSSSLHHLATLTAQGVLERRVVATGKAGGTRHEWRLTTAKEVAV